MLPNIPEYYGFVVDVEEKGGGRKKSCSPVFLFRRIGYAVSVFNMYGI